jgi:hypothetical protein
VELGDIVTRRRSGEGVEKELKGKGRIGRTGVRGRFTDSLVPVFRGGHLSFKTKTRVKIVIKKL